MDRFLMFKKILELTCQKKEEVIIIKKKKKENTRIEVFLLEYSWPSHSSLKHY